MKIIERYRSWSLILRIVVGLVIGAVLGLLFPHATAIGMLGSVFVGALKGFAPFLVLVLVVSSIAQGNSKLDGRFRFVIFEYLLSTFLAAMIAVTASYIFRVTIKLTTEAEAESIPSGIGEVLNKLLLSVVSNPVDSIASGNYIGVLFWAVLFGLAIKKIASDSTKKVLADIADSSSIIIRWIIELAPFGILGLVYSSVSTSGLTIFVDYGRLILLLVGCMAFMALVITPLMVFVILRRNPYPLVLKCLKESAITAFFTRSSAANIPVNMRLCERLGLDKDLYSVSIPLGSTINMDGAAITITVMTLATAWTMGINVDIGSAIVLSILSTVAACGASGVAGGSLLLIPMACSLFGIPTDVAMQVVGVGFVIGVVQDSVETALNSSGDVVFAATAEYRYWKKNGKSLPTFLGGTTKLDI